MCGTVLLCWLILVSCGQPLGHAKLALWQSSKLRRYSDVRGICWPEREQRISIEYTTYTRSIHADILRYMVYPRQQPRVNHLVEYISVSTPRIVVYPTYATLFSQCLLTEACLASISVLVWLQARPNSLSHYCTGHGNS